jgi:magnesium transporter
MHVWKNAQFAWIDITDPTPGELVGLAEEFGLSPSALQDCLQPVHLPQFVVNDAWCELLLRGYDSQSARSETVQDITRKFVIFWGEGFLLTVKRKEPPYFMELAERVAREVGVLDSTLLAPAGGVDAKFARDVREECVVRLARAIVESFDPALEAIERALDACERPGAERVHSSVDLRSLHTLKRRATILRRTLWRSVSVLEQVRAEFTEKKHARWRRVVEAAHRTHYYAEELEQAVGNIMSLQLAMSNLHISEASHKTNEVMRTLTLFSVVFLPLSFIAGVYGMNFENMPELRHPSGYHYVLGAMGFIALSLLVWFVRKGYLPSDWWRSFIVREGQDGGSREDNGRSGRAGRARRHA